MNNYVFDNDYDKVYLNKFNGVLNLNFRRRFDDNYTTIYVSAEDSSGFKLMYKNTILLYGTDGEFNKIIPILIEKDGYITISGYAKNLVVYTLGGFEFYNKDYLMPLKNAIARYEGEDCLLQYNDYSDILDSNFTLLKTFERMYDAQVCKSGSNFYIGVLYENNGLYYCNEMNNYNSEILISTGMKDACIVPNFSNNSIFVVYIKDNKIYYRTYSDSSGVGNEVLLYNSNSRLPIKIISAEYNEENIGIFGVIWNDGFMNLFCINSNNEITQKGRIKGINFKIVCYDNSVYIITNLIGCIDVQKYSIKDNLLFSLVKSKTFANVDDCKFVGDKVLLSCNQNYVVIDVNEL